MWSFWSGSANAGKVCPTSSTARLLCCGPIDARFGWSAQAMAALEALLFAGEDACGGVDRAAAVSRRRLPALGQQRPRAVERPLGFGAEHAPQPFVGARLDGRPGDRPVVEQRAHVG